MKIKISERQPVKPGFYETNLGKAQMHIIYENANYKIYRWYKYEADPNEIMMHLIIHPKWWDDKDI